MSIPNCQHIVADLAAKFPSEWRTAHNPSGGGPETEAFIRRLAWVLHSTVDARFGLNGKRGNPNDISDDALNFKGEGPGNDPTDGNRPVTVIDCIGGAGGPNPTPAWQVFDTLPGPGAWVQPVAVGGSGSGGGGTPLPAPPQPAPVTPQDIAEIKAAIKSLSDFLLNAMTGLSGEVAATRAAADSAAWDAKELNAARLNGWPATAPGGAVTFPDYSGKLFGQNLTLKPKGQS